MIFDPFTIKGVTFKNRILRSSIGGRTSFYDGTISSAFKNFEKRFAQNDVAGIITATITVDEKRWSPLEYAKLSHDRFIKPFQAVVKEVKKYDCRYIVQIGDHGGHTQMSLFSQPEDGKSASAGFDFIFGYRSTTTAMTTEEIEQTINNFAEAARRVREAGCDGLEITASKGYLIHQFLNPGINRRKDAYGGSVDKRFRFLEEIVKAVRRKVGPDFLFGIRLSAYDYNFLPINLRLPIVFPLKHYFMGNTIKETLYYGQKLEQLGVDYLHISNGYGFINPKENPGAFPIDEYKMFANATRHLSGKAAARALLMNLIPKFLLKPIAGYGWKFKPAVNADDAQCFKQALKIPIIANGGFQDRELIESTLQNKKADMVAMARPLLANVDLVNIFKQGKNQPEKPCSFCNRCTARTAVVPLGCYDTQRFSSQDEMEAQILGWSANCDEQLD